MGDCTALTAHRLDLFRALTPYVRPSSVVLDAQIVGGSAAVNPFLAVKSAFAEEEDGSSSGEAPAGMPNSAPTTAVVPVFQVPSASVLATVASISAVRELLAR